jgi:outer membrane protein
MNKNYVATGILAVCVVGLGIYVGFLHTRTIKIGYVRTGTVIEKYAGMLESKKMLEKKMQQWEANVDTLGLNYQKSLSNYNDQYKKLPEKERKDLKDMLDRQYGNMETYVSSIEKKALDENQKITQGILNQINNYIKKFSEEKKYDLILGVTANGNIMYGENSIDVTDEIVEGLNKEYSNK